MLRTPTSAPTPVASPAPATRPRPQAGAALLSEAEAALQSRRWSEAQLILNSASRLRPDDPQIDELRLIAAAEAGDQQTAKALVRELELRDEPTPSTHVAIATASLRNGKFTEADGHARAALDLDPHNPDAWATMAAAYAGLGWFEESWECLERAETGGLTDAAARWRIGRAINDWGLRKTPALLIGLLLTILFGAIAVGVALTIPFVFRELRVARLDPELAGLAELAWRDATRIRLLAATGVMASIGAWLMQLQFIG